MEFRINSETGMKTHILTAVLGANVFMSSMVDFGA